MVRVWAFLKILMHNGCQNLLHIRFVWKIFFTNTSLRWLCPGLRNKAKVNCFWPCSSLVSVVVGLNLDSWQQLSIVGKTPLEALALDIVEVATMEFLVVHQVVYSVLIGVFVQVPFGFYKFFELSNGSIHPVMN